MAMRSHWIAILCWLALSLAGCAGHSGFPLLQEPGAAEDRRILVTFIDRSIGRELAGNPTDTYRPRGLYANSGWSARFAGDLAERYGLHLIAQWPVTALGVACVVYEVPANRSMDQVLRDLEKSGEVESAQSMRTYRVLGQPQSEAGPYNDPYLHLQTGFQTMRFAAAHRFATGKGVSIAIIDTGVDVQHPDLAGQIALSVNLAPEPADHNTADLHGTAVAGVLAARADNGIGIAGVAPGAEVYALRACWPERPGASAALCNSFTLALALNEAIRYGTKVVNMSLTGPEDPLVRKLIETAMKRGLIIVAAEPGPGQPGGFPASVEGVIAVRSLATAAPSAILLAAPGSDVLTTVPRGAYDFLSGSSFAAPHVAGVIALLLELQPQLSSTEVRHLLASSNLAQSPSIDACAVIAGLQKSPSNSRCIEPGNGS
jgi:subtilisin family serine protease